MYKSDYYRTLLLGFVIGMASLSLIVMISTGEDVKEPVEPKSNFEVVDTYRGCDVVQWHYSMLAEYKYFLDCSNK